MNREDADQLEEQIRDIEFRCEPDVWYVGIVGKDVYGVRIGIQCDHWETIEFPEPVLKWIRTNGYGLYNIHYNERMGLFADVLPE